MAEKPLDTIPPKYPNAADEIASVLGFSSEQSVEEPASTAENELDLPMLQPEQLEPSVVPSPSFGGQLAKRVVLFLPYVAVFSLVFLGYYYFFDPGNKTESGQVASETTQTEIRNAMAKLQTSNRSNYEQWVSQFFFVTDSSTAPDMNKLGANGLTYFENFTLNLNPKIKSIRGEDRYDAYYVLEGKSPRTAQTLSTSAQSVVEKYFDKPDILSRLQGSSIPTENEIVQNSSPVPGTVTTSNSVVLPSSVSINTEIPGRLEIPKLGVNVPVMWSREVDDMDHDLLSGVAHYPGTPLPGQVGTAYISGHSSNYVWVNADFNRVFSKINQLQPGDNFKVTVVGADGKDVRLFYTVRQQIEFASSDQKQFENTAESRVALSTCWPVGTTQRRLVTYGLLSSIE